MRPLRCHTENRMKEHADHKQLDILPRQACNTHHPVKLNPTANEQEITSTTSPCLLMYYSFMRVNEGEHVFDVGRRVTSLCWHLLLTLTLVAEYWGVEGFFLWKYQISFLRERTRSALFALLKMFIPSRSPSLLEQRKCLVAWLAEWWSREAAD